ncbi:YeeE/YedE family protein [Galbibacter pacificus]|uniref:YeeE/YedE thiosulfate transporter family protein n=1 Tax=Galbibacter pacificus TaxID=2996052 RepID=A0ABT6FN55_9FLAO|nr:YeeE/YedE thiosulfate transporter family protein [Galbibacter pacificus]MDG3581215.1 YeeE/YedE thiosulfate transporter family protein [Galbibacter pacificus]MDG3584693.1 YeeE/YedE thiosulfate transporter family protein [Galbibacter pacificus]
MSWIYDPWPWYVSGPLIALVMFVLLLTGKQFGMSSNLRTLCSIGGAGRVSGFFKFDWKKQGWNLLVVLGAVIGGFLASRYMSDNTVKINPDLAGQLSREYHIESAGKAYLPAELFSTEQLDDPFTIGLLLLGGFLVGFGSRYAGGCTSGHAISGLSNLQVPSLIAVIGFFIGGLVMVHILYPLIFG